jgi:hypothetical protein
MQALSVSGRRSRTTAGRQVRRSFNPLIPLLAPWVSVVVVAELLPEAGGIVKHQLDAADPLGRFPEIQVWDQQSCGSTVLRDKLFSVLLKGDPRFAVEQILQRQVGAVTALAVSHRVICLGLNVGKQSVH